MKNFRNFFVFTFATVAIFFASGCLSNNVALAALVNINTANATELDTIPEVGPSTAAKIIAYREASGPFLVIEDIMKVSGIKEATFAKMKDFITVDETSGGDTDGGNDGGTATTTATSTDIIPDTETDTGTSTSLTTTTTSSNSGGNTVVYSVHYIQEDLSDYEEPTTFEVSAGRARLSYVNSPVSFTAKHKVSGSLLDKNCDYNWNFGDGVSLTGEKVEHIYKYAGEYNVILNGTCGDLKSVARTAVRVVVPNISVNTKTDGAVEISNQGKYEINLYNWKIQSGNTAFTFPQDTIISANKSVTFAPEYLKITDLNNGIILVDASNKAVAQSNTNMAGTDPEQEISLEEFKKFVLAYQSAGQPTRQPATLMAVGAATTSVVESVKMESEIPMTAAVADVIINNKDEESEPGFWSKVFHPVRTIKETFYR